MPQFAVNPKTALISIFFLAAAAVLATPAAAQRSVPVHFDNTASDPIPVELVRTSAAGANGVRYVFCAQAIPGPGVDGAYPGCVEIDSLGVGVSRVMIESGEKGGTQDINIGVGELSTVTFTKSPDGVSARLFAYAINGNSCGQAQLIALEQRPGWSKPQPVLELELERTFVQSHRIDPTSQTETVELYFNKIQMTSYSRDANGAAIDSSEHCWDTAAMTPCSL